jgi:hypothetical protein
MKAGVATIAMLIICSAISTDNAWARATEVTVTGIVSNIDPVTRIATVTPQNGPPVVVQFSWNIGGPCDGCLGGGRGGPVFEKTITEGSVWTVTYTSSIPEGTAIWFPGGTVHTVYMAMRPGEDDPSPRGRPREERGAEVGAP